MLRQHAVRRLMPIHEGADIDDNRLTHVEARFERGRSHMRSEHDFVGTRQSEEARIDAQGGNIGDAMRKALLKVFSSTELTFNEDGTWRLRQKAGTETVDSQGTYTCEENKVLLKPGKDGLKPLGADELTLHEDGSLTGQWAGGEDFYRLIKKEN